MQRFSLSGTKFLPGDLKQTALQVTQFRATLALEDCYTSYYRVLDTFVDSKVSYGTNLLDASNNTKGFTGTL